MKSISFRSIVPVVVFFFSASVYAQGTSEDWNLELEQDGVTVYTRAMEGSKILESKAETKIRQDIDKIVGFYLNPEKCTTWIPSCRTAKLLEKKSETNLIVYREISIPWPFKNQEYVINQTISSVAETGEVRVQFNALKDYPSGTTCCRRYKAINGFWRFTPTDDHVLVTYQVHFVPGGKFPASVINSEVPSMLVEMLTSLKNL